MDLHEAQTMAKELVEQHLDGWTFSWNRRKRAFGLCNYTTHEIQLSVILTAGETQEATRQTILHEIAHALAGPHAKHGPQWKAVARRLGVRNPTATRQHTSAESDRPKYAWAIVHEGEIVKGYHRRPSVKTFRNLPNMWLNNRPETRGKLKIVQL